MHLPGDGHLPLPAPHGVLEAQRDSLVQVDAALDGLLSRAALVEDVGKEVAESRRSRAADLRGKIEPLESKCRSLSWRNRPRAGVVAPPALRVAQCLVGFGDLPEMR